MMTEKIGIIKNPLTIIAIFAGIAEVSGTIVLPFIDKSNQQLFIYFLIIFPILLVILFFVTLNFNNKVLYAPSDYKDEEHFLKFFRYDSSKEQQVAVEIGTNEQIKLLYEQVSQIGDTVNNKIQLIESRLAVGDNKDPRIEKAAFTYKISEISQAETFVEKMKTFGYQFEIYRSIHKEGKDFDKQKSIWLGRNVPIEICKEVIKIAKDFYPHLAYIHIPGDLNNGKVPSHVNDQIYIAGATRTSEKVFKLQPLAEKDFQKINSFNNKEELTKFIQTFYP